MKDPKVIVMGAGAVGCFFGGMLARAGHDVTMIARPDHVEAIKRDGLYMDCLSFKEYVSVKATEQLNVIDQADLILFCVKSPDSGKTIELIKPYLKPDAIILSLQNGVDNCHRIRQLIDNPVYPAVVYVATAMAGPGHLKHHGRGELAIGGWEPERAHDSEIQTQLKSVSHLFEAAGVPCKVSADVRQDLWYKFLVNCCYNGISAIGQIQYGDMVAVESVRDLIDELGREVVAIARHEGIAMSDKDAKYVIDQIPKTMPTQKSSTGQDIARRKPTEIDYLNGLIVRKGKQYGIPAPANQAIYALVKMIEHYNT
ncbi:ketopantoate reductase [Jezberella montanilacus]|uniref:2-dehydropantoate 2-reductase n=1 Tax=Jezberella montanilacus TaxID=323426 RepID=A0A2T0XL82_9BURK|nr:2-dehydropantoate 2-reductase [Jezberella montanilacus]PRY99693.1 ketopantoate reductase [Jezberella montanilacus]